MNKQKLKNEYHEQLSTIEMSVKKAKEQAKRQKKLAKEKLFKALNNNLSTPSNIDEQSNNANDSSSFVNKEKEKIVKMGAINLIKTKQLTKWKNKNVKKNFQTIPKRLDDDWKNNIAIFENLKNENSFCSIETLLPYINFIADTNVEVIKLQLIIVTLIKLLAKKQIIKMPQGIIRQVKKGPYRFLVYDEGDFALQGKKIIYFADNHFRKILLKILQDKIVKGSKILITPNLALTWMENKIVILNGLGSIK